MWRILNNFGYTPIILLGPDRSEDDGREANDFYRVFVNGEYIETSCLLPRETEALMLSRIILNPGASAVMILRRRIEMFTYMPRIGGSWRI